MNVFQQILAGERPARRVWEDEHCIVIHDHRPRAPVHLLVIPRLPLESLGQTTGEHRALLGHLLWVAGQVARQEGIGDAFRVVTNSGHGAGQRIFHLHLHVLGGRPQRESALRVES